MFEGREMKGIIRATLKNTIAMKLGEERRPRGKTQPHATGSKKLKYGIERARPGRSGVCQEAESQKPPLDPSHHLPPNTSYTIFPRRSRQWFSGWQPKARTFLVRNPAVPKCSLPHKRAVCFLMPKHFLQLCQ